MTDSKRDQYQELILQCIELILDKPELSDKTLMLKTIELILNKSPNRSLEEVIKESQKLFNFIQNIKS